MHSPQNWSLLWKSSASQVTLSESSVRWGSQCFFHLIVNNLCQILQLQMIMLCSRTFTSHGLSQFAKIHFKPPHMVLAAAGGKTFSLFLVIFCFSFLLLVTCEEQLPACAIVCAEYPTNVHARNLLTVYVRFWIYESEVLLSFWSAMLAIVTKLTTAASVIIHMLCFVELVFFPGHTNEGLSANGTDLYCWISFWRDCLNVQMCF